MCTCIFIERERVADKVEEEKKINIERNIREIERERERARERESESEGWREGGREGERERERARASSMRICICSTKFVLHMLAACC